MDNYFTGNELSWIDGMSFIAGGQRFNAPSISVPGGATTPLTISAGASNGTSEFGVLLLLNTGSTGAPEGNEARAVTVK